MCWVIPPASPAATSVVADRVEQRGLAVVDVAHDGDDRRADDEVGLVVLEGGLRRRPPRRHGRSRPSARTPRRGRSTVSSVRVCVSVAISPCCISFLMISALLTPNVSETSRTVAPELTLSASGSSVLRVFSSGDSSNAGRRRRPRRRGGRCGGPCDMWSRRAACESMTTRRRFLPAPSPPGPDDGRLTGWPGAFRPARRPSRSPSRASSSAARRRLRAPSARSPDRRSRKPS